MKPPATRAAWTPEGPRPLRRAGLLLSLCTTWALGCQREVPPDGVTDQAAADAAPVETIPSRETQARAAAPAADAGAADAAPAADGGDPEASWEGPFFAATQSSVGIYEATDFSRKNKIGYLRNGGRVAVHPEVIEKSNCSSGWYRLVSGGYVCANHGTTKLDSPKARFSVKQPDLEAILPYKYVRNAKNGTPLYNSVPTPEQMLEYEPYLRKSSSKPKKDKVGEQEEAPAEKATRPASHVRSEAGAGADAAPSMGAAMANTWRNLLADAGGAPSAPEAPAKQPPEKPWWQREDADDRLHQIRLDDLAAGADGVLAKRMIKGFYVAVDKSFKWNNRLWYKTTKGLVAPADRFWQAEQSKFQGVELDGEEARLPVGWTYGWQKTRPKYEVDIDSKKVKTIGTLGRHVLVKLTGQQLDVGKTTYAEATDGFWVRTRDLRIARPGPPPPDLAPRERWLDINLGSQTIVAFEGTRPVYATLISSGKEHKVKAKDHRSPTGEWRIREKHVTATMDGDGSAAGDLPYSIEDVPYVMYYDGSYAVHGAFWHSNYGVRMSHGCINLSPLDAKRLFFFTEPAVRKGWHGAWSSESRPGSRVVVHD